MAHLTKKTRISSSISEDLPAIGVDGIRRKGREG